MKAIERRKLGDLVYEQLLEQIVQGKWPPGTKIPSENDLSKALGVSRITVREALQRLNSLGLAESHRGEGTYVKQLSPETHMTNSLTPLLVLGQVDMMHVLEYRKIIEVETAGLAAKRATEQDLDNLETIFARMKKNAGEVEQFAVADLDFHFALAGITKNPLIVEMNFILNDILTKSMIDIVGSLGTNIGLYYHREILDALKSQNETKAKEAMEEHLMETIVKMSENID